MPYVSLFKSVNDVSNPENFELEDYLDKIRDGFWQDQVLEIRALKTKEEKTIAKRSLPTCCLSGRFLKRKDSGLETHSGFISIDLDDLDDAIQVKDILCQDGYVYSCFLSTSGYGLRVLFKINKNKHRESFLGISEYLFEQYKLFSDPNGINVSKPYYVSYDPDLFINTNTVSEWKSFPKEKKIEVEKTRIIHTKSDFIEVFDRVVSSGKCIADNYQDWLKMAFSISEEYGEGGRQYFHDLSLTHPTYSYATANKQYSQCLKAKGSGVNISSFFFLAKEAGIDVVSTTTETVKKIVYNQKKMGVSKEGVIKHLEKFQDITGVEELVDALWISPEKPDDDISTFEKLEIFLNKGYELQFNEITGFVEIDGDQLIDRKLNTVYVDASKFIDRLQFADFLRYLKSENIDSYNPFHKFLNSDGKKVEIIDGHTGESPLLDKLASCINTDEPTKFEYFFKKWYVSIVASIHGTHSPLVLCLMGGQNTGKTEFFRRLLPSELRSYYAESKLDRGKDDEILMCEKIIVMDDEMGGKMKKDSENFKDIISKQAFSLRRPYGHSNETMQRIAVLCGTSNTYEIIYDTTGNRRVIPTKVFSIDQKLYNSINKTDLLKEAFMLYKQGFDWRITGEDIEYLNQNIDIYEVTNMEREMIQKYFSNPPMGDTDAVRMTTTEIKIDLERYTKNIFNTKTLAAELRKAGFLLITTRDVQMGTTPKKWIVKLENRSNMDNLPF